MSGKLNGQVAVVTGGNSGIGLATAQLFAREGAHVFITGRREAELAAAVKTIQGKVTAVQGDVSKLADLDRLYAIVEKEAGRVDVLFANAGAGTFAPIDEITEAHYDGIFDANVKGLVFTVQKALRLMKSGGSIILNASIMSIKAAPAFSVYAASKAAVRSFARGWTMDLKGRNIRVNVLSPGPIETPGITNLTGGNAQEEQFKKGLVAATPLGRMGQADEIAKAALFLATSDSSFVQGAELFVDGGMAQI